ncbi:beta-ketoacyl-ACP synthase III [Sneathiella sp.]|uniref:beta-ketoacyl-ACP synthase III n=1 Tax=Sneathiella sp. TaxID=1964365 RepID=UPI0035627044
MRRSVITATGSYLPERILTNKELSEMVDTTDEWIVSRSGIESRHIAADDELTSDLATHAARAALDMAGLDANDIDLIIVATATPDETFPATATVVQKNLGMKGGFAFDIQAVCTGFLYALATADNFVKSGQVNRALVIGAETFSRIIDWTDRGTCVLFADGAGAVILEAAEGAGTSDDRGILTSHLHSDGEKHDLLYVDGGPSSTQTTGFLRMAGPEVFRHAVTNLTSVVHEALAATGLTAADIDWLIPHQANKRIIDGTGRKLKLSPDKVVVTVHKHGNTSAASVPLALDEAVRDGRIQRGQLLLLEAMGGGFTWGSALLRW